MEDQEKQRQEEEKWKIGVERRNNNFYRQGLYGYVSVKKSQEKAPKVFLFPLSREGFQTVGSKKELAHRLKTKFRQAYPSPEMQCPYNLTQAKGPGPMKVQQYKLTAYCQICTNSLVYVKNMFTQNEYKLVKMVQYHVHGKDPHKVQQILRKTHNYSRFTLRQGRPYQIKPIQFDQKTQNSIEDFIKKLPVELTNESRCKIVCDKFKIGSSDYERVMKGIRSQYDISFKELISKFQSKSYTYRYLPANLTQINEEFVLRQKQAEFQHHLRSHQHDRIKNVNQIDLLNPDLPNVLLIISPQMKELFYKYGQYVGFDLTFSLIREKPEQAKQYLVGVFAGTSESRKIMIYGLVITNNQSEEVYKYIFKQFITIMGKGPQTFVTDEQISIFYALQSLKEQGIWLGQHLLDMFHILKKFRKRCQSGTFQLFRKMMHSRDRYQYRRAFKAAMLQVSSDDELNMLQSFDMQSERYCFSQVLGSFVGIGISDAINEKFHDLIKAQLPYQSKYIKAVCVILDLIESRNNLNKYGIIDKNPLEQRMSLPFMKQYRTVLSDKIFHFLLKEVYKSLPYQILSKYQQNYYNKLTVKLQPDQVLLRSRDIFKVRANGGVFGVWIDHGDAINQNRPKYGKLRCYCQFQQKSGYLCSHIIKVLMHHKQEFYDNIHIRWIIRYDQIDEGLKKFIYRERKRHHHTRVRMRKAPKSAPMDQDIQEEKIAKGYRKLMDEDVESDQQSTTTRNDHYDMDHQDLYDLDHKMAYDDE